MNIFFYFSESEAAEYCQHDGFRPSCLDNQVIVTTSAKYGRMKMGDCIKTDFGYMGCSVDVLADINALCSGTRGCVVPVPNAAFDEAKPCHAELHSYLEVDYHCANGMVYFINIYLDFELYILQFYCIYLII